MFTHGTVNSAAFEAKSFVRQKATVARYKRDIPINIFDKINRTFIKQPNQLRIYALLCNRQENKFRGYVRAIE